jgi:hypothetical protein
MPAIAPEIKYSRHLSPFGLRRTRSKNPPVLPTALAFGVVQRSRSSVGWPKTESCQNVGWVNNEMGMPKLTNEILDAAILGFEEQKRRLDAQLAELRAMRNGANQTTPASARPRRKMSAAGRKAIAAAQRQRWAAVKGQGVAQATPKKAKRKLSPAGRAAIVAALKKRWAAKRS